MAQNVQDHTVEDVDVRRNGNIHRNSAERRVLHTIEHIGRRDYSRAVKERLASFVIAILFCAALLAAFYLAVHF